MESAWSGPDVFAHLVILLAAIVAGAVNAIAGGGTLITFPALLWIGRNSIVANATNTVALWPGSLAGMLGFRRDLMTVRRWLWWLTLPSLAGGGIGAWLLLRTPTRTFDHLIPFLILGATLLLAAQGVITSRLQRLARAHEDPTAGWVTFVFVFQFLVGIYGGYFGAGIGILMLAVLGLIGLTDMHQMNGLKNMLAICINGVAAIWFACSHVVIWSDVGLMAAGSIAGGFLGARVAHRFGRRFVRIAVIVIGLTLSIAFFLRR
jgi:uncharacterized membrane protein YfcA